MAETAITINGIKVVIDAGWDRQQIYDIKKKLRTTELKTITQAAANQRAGRAGRTGPGICYRLYSEE